MHWKPSKWKIGQQQTFWPLRCDLTNCQSVIIIMNVAFGKSMGIHRLLTEILPGVLLAMRMKFEKRKHINTINNVKDYYIIMTHQKTD